MPPVEQLYAENLTLKSALAQLQTRYDEEIARLNVQIDWLKKKLFGPGCGDGARSAEMA